MATSPDEILNRLNELVMECEDCGNIFPEMFLEQREDDGLPPPTPEELAAIEQEAAKNAKRHQSLLDEIEELRISFYGLTGEFPTQTATGTYHYIGRTERRID